MNVSECDIVVAVSCEKGTSLIEVAKIMKEEKHRHVIITNDEKPVGIISPVDIVNKVVAEGKDYKDLKAEDIMTAPIETVDVSAELSEAYFKMASRNTFSCPVTEDGKLKGILLLNEAMRNLMKSQEKK